MARASAGASRLDTGILVGCVALALFALVMPSHIRDSISSALRKTVLAPLVELERKSASVRASIDTRSQVLETRGKTVSENLVSSEIRDENERLRGLLHLGARLQQGFVVAEVIPGRGNDDQYSIVLSAGSAAGIEPFTPVVTADGLVGMVQTVDATTSYAITWAHPEFAVSAMSVDQQALGIVKPHLGSGSERWLLEMRGVAFRTSLDTGTVIVSAGLGPTYPRGVRIGTVIGELATTEKWARTYLLRPAVLPSSIGPVMVLLAGRVSQGVGGVWTDAASAESAARSVAEAGDSLARKAALDELAARRAAIDSTAADTLVRDSTGRVIGRTVGARADSIRRDSVRRADSLRSARQRADSLRRPPGPPPASMTGPPPP